MIRSLQIRRWLCATLVLPLVAGPAFGAEGVIGDIMVPSCPACRTGSRPCPANVKYFGYYPTHWRPWPGTEPSPTAAPPVEQAQPEHVELPPPGQEGFGKPSGTPGDTGTGNSPSGSTTDPTNPNSPANPNAIPPGAGVPMLNGLPLPNGGQLPNGLPAPNAPFQNNVPRPNGGFIPNTLPAPNQPDPNAKGSQILAPVQTPVAALPLIPSEPVRLNQAWPDSPRQATATSSPTFTAAIAPTSMPAEIEPRIAPASEPTPAYQWPPANMLRSSTMKAGFQTPVEPTVPKGSTSGAAAAWVEPLPPLDSTRGPAREAMPGNSLRIDMPPISAQASVANQVDRSPRPMQINQTWTSREFDHADDSNSLRIVVQKPAHPAAIPADEWLSRQASTASGTQGAAIDATPGSGKDDVVAARFSLPADQPQSQFVHPASWVDRSQPTAPAAPAPTKSSASPPLNWSAANSPATLAPLYNGPAADRLAGNASLNSPGTLSSAPHRTAAQAGPAGEIRFSPLRDAVADIPISADEERSTSMTAIDPLQIGRTMADDRQPAMRALPIENALPTNRFEASDYVSQDRAAKPSSYASSPQPTPGSLASGPRRTTDPAVRTVGFEQAGPSGEPKLTAINPLEVARSLGPTPAPSISPLPPQPAANAGGAAANNSPQMGR